MSRLLANRSSEGMKSFGFPNDPPVAQSDLLEVARSNERRLYVSASDGDDQNHGQSWSYPLKTIREACFRATSKTSIFVASGDYYEEIPIFVPPYVSILGDSLRTVFLYSKSWKDRELDPNGRGERAIEVPDEHGTMRNMNRVDYFHLSNGSYLYGLRFMHLQGPGSCAAFPCALAQATIDESGSLGGADILYSQGWYTVDRLPSIGPTWTTIGTRSNTERIEIKNIWIQTPGQGYAISSPVVIHSPEDNPNERNTGRATIEEVDANGKILSIRIDSPGLFYGAELRRGATHVVDIGGPGVDGSAVAELQGSYITAWAEERGIETPEGCKVLEPPEQFPIVWNAVEHWASAWKYRGKAPLTEAPRIVHRRTREIDTGIAILGNATSNAGNHVSEAQLMRANLEDIQNHVMDWIDTEYPSLLTEAQKTEYRQKMGSLIQAFSSDLEFGSCGHTLEATLAYVRGTRRVLPTFHRIEIAAAIVELASYVRSLAEWDGNASDELDALVSLVTDTITEPERVENEGNYVYESERILQQRDALRDAMNEWIGENSAVVLNTGELLDAYTHDMLNGAYGKTSETAWAYFDGATSVLEPNQVSPTVSAMEHLRNLVKADLSAQRDALKNLSTAPINMDVADRLTSNRTKLHEEVWTLVNTRFDHVLVGDETDPSTTAGKCYQNIGYLIDALRSDLSGTAVGEYATLPNLTTPYLRHEAMRYYDEDVFVLPGEQIRPTVEFMRFTFDTAIELISAEDADIFQRSPDGQWTVNGEIATSAPALTWIRKSRDAFLNYVGIRPVASTVLDSLTSLMTEMIQETNPNPRTIVVPDPISYSVYQLHATNLVHWKIQGRKTSEASWVDVDEREISIPPTKLERFRVEFPDTFVEYRLIMIENGNDQEMRLGNWESCTDEMPTILVDEPTIPSVQAEAIAILDPVGGIESVKIINAGFRYTSTPTVTVTGNAVLEAIINSDQRIEEIVVVNSGSGYGTSPAITIGPPTPASRAKVSVDTFDQTTGRISSLRIDDPGFGYTETPFISIPSPLRYRPIVTTSPYVQNCSNISGPWDQHGFRVFETHPVPFDVNDIYNTPDAPRQIVPDSIGGLRIDGNATHSSSPLKSFVCDAFTQVSQGGTGFLLINRAYAQFVSTFGTLCSVHIKTLSGSFANASNSVTDFGDVGLQANGYDSTPTSRALVVPPSDPGDPARTTWSTSSGHYIQDMGYYSDLSQIKWTNLGSGYAFDAQSPIYVKIDEPELAQGEGAKLSSELDAHPILGVPLDESFFTDGGALRNVASLERTTTVFGYEQYTRLFSGSGYKTAPKVTVTPPGSGIPAEAETRLSGIRNFRVRLLEGRRPDFLSLVYIHGKDSLVRSVQTAFDTNNVPIPDTYDITVVPSPPYLETDTELEFYPVSYITAVSHAMEYVGSGITYNALPQHGGAPRPEREVQSDAPGKVFYSTSDHLGNFKVGDLFEVEQSTGKVTIDAELFDLRNIAAIGPFLHDGVPVGVTLREVSDNQNLLSDITGAPGGETVPTQNAVARYVYNRKVPDPEPPAEDNDVLQVNYQSGDALRRFEWGPLTRARADFTMEKTLTVDQTLDVTGATTLESTLDVTGSVTVDTDTLVVDATNDRVGIGIANPNKTLDVIGDVAISANDTMTGTLDVAGATTLENTLDVTGSVTVDTDTLVVDATNDRVGIGIANPTKTLDVIGDVAISGSDTMDGTLDVTGATTLESTLDVASNTTLGGTLDVTGSVTVDTDTLVIDATNDRVGIGIENPNKTLDVVGDVAIAANDTMDGTLDVAGATTLKSTLDVTGKMTGSDLTLSGDLVVNGTTTTVHSTEVTIEDPVFRLGIDSTIADSKDRGIEFVYGDGTETKVGFFGWRRTPDRFAWIKNATNQSEVFSGTLGDIEAPYFHGDLKGNADTVTDGVYISRTIFAGEGLTGGGNLSQDRTISHATLYEDQVVVNNARGTVIQDITYDKYGHVESIGSYNLDNRYYTETEADGRFLNVTGDTMTGDITMGTHTIWFDASDLVDTPGDPTTKTVIGGLTVTGETILQDTLTITKALTLNDMLSVESNAAVGGTLGVTSDATVGGTLGVTSDATVGGTLGVTSNATVGGTLGVTSNATVGGTLGVTSNATVGGTLGVMGVITATGGISGILTGGLDGNATTASKWEVGRMITLTGDVVGSVLIDGSKNVYLSTTVNASNITVGTLPVARGGTGTTSKTGTGSVVLSASPTFTGTISAVNLNVSGVITESSDGRYKTEIRTIENALEKVDGMRGVTYRMSEDGSHTRVGLIAQEVEQVVPEAVITDDSLEARKSVAYGNLVGVLVEAIKTLRNENRTLERTVASLNDRLTALETERSKTIQ